MAAPSLKNPPKAPADFDAELSAIWKDSCLRFIDATGCIYRSDLPYVEMYCRSYQRWKEIQGHANISGLYDERQRLNEVYKFESELANKLKQNYRAMENTVLERVRAGQAGEGVQGGRTGVRQKAAREGVPQVGSAKKASSGGVSWLDDARKKSAK